MTLNNIPTTINGVGKARTLILEVKAEQVLEAEAEEAKEVEAVVASSKLAKCSVLPLLVVH